MYKKKQSFEMLTFNHISHLYYRWHCSI